jgi:16S rRNA (adenine1518-N6/adenine1519-N6)-dimethyltransferase
VNREELFEILAKLDIKPNKDLSQNFLISNEILEKIAILAEVQPGENILEIGPGLGALTNFLLKQKTNVVAVEKDPILAKFLKPSSNLKVICADILKLDLAQILTSSCPEAPWKVIANLPYQITTLILNKLAEQSLTSITVMIQKEVADKLTSKKRSLLSLRLESKWQFVERFEVSPGCFYPEPKVDSTVIRFDRKANFTNEDIFPLAEKAFKQKRKKITNSLNCSEAPLEKANISKDARPEELTYENWIDLWVTGFNKQLPL